MLGFTRAEISLILLGELAVLTLLALPVGAVIGYGSGQLIMAGFNNEVYRLSFVVSPATDRLVVPGRHRRGGRVRPAWSGGGSTGSIWSRCSRHGSDADAAPARSTVASWFAVAVDRRPAGRRAVADDRPGRRGARSRAARSS